MNKPENHIIKKVKVSKVDHKMCPLADHLQSPPPIPLNELIFDLSTPDLHKSCIKPTEEIITSQKDTIKEIDNYPADFSSGLFEAKLAVIKSLNNSIFDIFTLKPDNVFLESSVHSALRNLLHCICNTGDNFLIPVPSQYHQLMKTSKIVVEENEYNVDNEGKVNFEDIKGQINSKTKAIQVCNPMTPQGVIMNETHLKELQVLSKEHSLVVIFDNTFRLQVFDNWQEDITDTTRQIFNMSKDLGPELVYLGGIEEDYALWRQCKFSWLIKFGKNLGNIWEHLKGFRLMGAGPNSQIQRGFSNYMKNYENQNQTWKIEVNLMKIKQNYETLLNNLNNYEGVLKISEMYKATIYAMICIDQEKIGHYSDYELYEEFITTKKFKVIPIKHCFGGKITGFRVVLVCEPVVMEEFVMKLKEFITNKVRTHRQDVGQQKVNTPMIQEFQEIVNVREANK